MAAWPLGHDYGDSAYYDQVHFFADKVTYRRLGLLVFASIFHANHIIALHLLHPEATVKKIRMQCGVTDPYRPKLTGFFRAEIEAFSL